MQNVSRRSLLAAGAVFGAPGVWAKSQFTVAPFEADITPPAGSALCFGLVVPASSMSDPLLARGLVIRGPRMKPVVICALDWLGAGNGGMDEFRVALARAAGTEPARVAVQTVHQHDAPGYDSTAEALLGPVKLGETLQPGVFCREAVRRVAAAVKRAKPIAVTHVSTGSAAVDGVASNRRILDGQGKFLFQRFTACRQSPHCDAPVGVIDPLLRTVSFHNGETRVATLHYYSTHPMSHYGKGVVSADFVGMARRAMDGFHVYFTGAAGNVGAGKYNDGAPEKRAVLASRIEAAMRASIASEKKAAVGRLEWKVVQARLPLREGAEFSEDAVVKAIHNDKLISRDRASAGRYLGWLRLHKQGRTIPVGALHWDGGAVLHLPGELFVEYQLAAQRERPGSFVAMAAYGDYGPMYIGTAKAYEEGGYETSLVSRVGPGVEDVLLGVIRAVL